MNNLSPQNRRIHDFLSEHPGGLTSGEAARWVPQIMRLSERIREMEASGIGIERVGEGNYKRYFLAVPKQRQISLFDQIARGDISFRHEA